MATQQEIDQVRENIGGANTVLIISDTSIGNKLDQYPDPDYTSATRVYLATLDCLVVMKAYYAASGSTFREEVGDVVVTKANESRYKIYCDLYNWWLSNPPKGVSGVAEFKFGGVSKAESERVEKDSDSLGSGIKQGWFSDNSFVTGNETQGGGFNPRSFREI